MPDGYNYYALTFGSTTKEDPAGVARHKAGTFEVYRAGRWVENQELAGIFFGEYNDYEDISSRPL